MKLLGFKRHERPSNDYEGVSERNWLQYLGKERNKEAGACPGKYMLKESFATEHLSSFSHETP